VKKTFVWRLGAAVGMVLYLGACAYRIDVQQGNIITQDMLNQLRPGMTKQQVRLIMGTPLLQDVFSQQRWDYYYSLKPGYGKLETRHVILAFEADALASVSGDMQVDLQHPASPSPAPARSEEPLL